MKIGIYCRVSTEEQKTKGQYKKPEAPLLILIDQKNEAKVFENAKAGTNKLTRTDNKQALIFLTNNKLIGLPWGNGDVLKVWIAHENQALALPHLTIS